MSQTNNMWITKFWQKCQREPYNFKVTKLIKEYHQYCCTVKFNNYTFKWYNNNNICCIVYSIWYIQYVTKCCLSHWPKKQQSSVLDSFSLFLACRSCIFTTDNSDHVQFNILYVCETSSEGPLQRSHPGVTLSSSSHSVFKIPLLLEE